MMQGQSSAVQFTLNKRFYNENPLGFSHLGLINFDSFNSTGDTMSSRHWRTKTPIVRTALSRPCPAGQIDNGHHFFKNSGQNPDKTSKIFFRVILSKLSTIGNLHLAFLTAMNRN